MPAKSATKEDLFHRLEEQSKVIRTLKGTITLDASGGGSESGVLTEYRQTSAYVFVERPQNIRMKVLAPLVYSTIADMVSDGQEFRLSIPVNNEWFESAVDAHINSKSPIANLRPQHFLAGLFVDISPYAGKSQVKYLFNEQTENRHSYYVVTFIDVSAEGPEVRTLEKLWIDRSEDLEVTRKQIYAPDGRIETDAEYSDYHKEGEIKFPRIVVINRPIEDYTVRMTFQKTALNDKLPDNTFTLDRPEGSKLVELSK